MRIAITGATGLLGRNFLFEILKNNINCLNDYKIYILGRKKENVTIGKRIKLILEEDGKEYLALNTNKFKMFVDNFENSIKCLDIDLDKELLDLNEKDFIELMSEPVDKFIHIASLTDFRSTPGVEESLRKTIYYGTEQILKLISVFSVKEFYYVGSAYSSGYKAGVVKADFSDLNQQFRNPYEKIKLETELMVVEYLKKAKIKYKIFRPSTISGRLIENELGSVSKFDVFYSWAGFFLRLKIKENLKDLYDDVYKLKLRIFCNFKSGLNIVPADYAAKVMYRICWESNDKWGESYHLVNNQETPHVEYINAMLNFLNIKDVILVEDYPRDLNKQEKFYYKTVGAIFTPYITSEPMLFDTDNLKHMKEKYNLECPSINIENFLLLLKYAKKHNFGLKDLKI